jgi:hypothetical protein
MPFGIPSEQVLPGSQLFQQVELLLPGETGNMSKLIRCQNNVVHWIHLLSWTRPSVLVTPGVCFMSM